MNHRRVPDKNLTTEYNSKIRKKTIFTLLKYPRFNKYLTEFKTLTNISFHLPAHKTSFHQLSFHLFFNIVNTFKLFQIIFMILKNIYLILFQKQKFFQSCCCFYRVPPYNKYQQHIYTSYMCKSSYVQNL